MYNTAIRYLDTRSIYRHEGGIPMFRNTHREAGRTRPDHTPMLPIFRKPDHAMGEAVRDARSRFTDAYIMDTLHWR